MGQFVSLMTASHPQRQLNRYFYLRPHQCQLLCFTYSPFNANYYRDNQLNCHKLLVKNGFNQSTTVKNSDKQKHMLFVTIVTLDVKDTKTNSKGRAIGTLATGQLVNSFKLLFSTSTLLWKPSPEGRGKTLACHLCG